MKAYICHIAGTFDERYPYISVSADSAPDAFNNPPSVYEAQYWI
jgi:hypothetical protein